MRGNILRSYRELLTLLKRLPTNSQIAAGKEAKAKILAHCDETNAVKITDLHKQLVAKISFLRLTTTRRPGEKLRQGSGTFVLRKGGLVESDSARENRCEQLYPSCTMSQIMSSEYSPRACGAVELLMAR